MDEVCKGVLYYGSYEQFRALQKTYKIPDEAFDGFQSIPTWATHFAEVDQTEMKRTNPWGVKR